MIAACRTVAFNRCALWPCAVGGAGQDKTHERRLLCGEGRLKPI